MSKKIMRHGKFGDVVLFEIVDDHKVRVSMKNCHINVEPDGNSFDYYMVQPSGYQSFKKGSRVQIFNGRGGSFKIQKIAEDYDSANMETRCFILMGYFT